MRILMLGLLLLSAAAQAQQPVVTLRATVTGNQEQPRVMYILPWQPPDGRRHYEYSPTRALADDLFRQLHRDEFVREIEYRETLGSVDSTVDDLNKD